MALTQDQRERVILVASTVAAFLSVPILVYQVVLLSGQTELQRQVAVSDRFNKLAEQLGSDTRIERIAGVHGLRDLAEDEETAQPRTLKILAAQLQLITHQEGISPVEIATTSGALTAVSRLIDPGHFNAERLGRPLAYDISDARLNDLPMLNLVADGGYFARTNLTGSTLTNATIRCTDLTDAQLDGADLRGATLERVLMNGADLTNVIFDGDTHVVDAFWDDEDPPELPSGFPVDRVSAPNDEDAFNAACKI